jgi:hypothetical protein
MQVVFHSRAGFACKKPFAAVQDATGASRSSCRQNRGRAVPTFDFSRRDAFPSLVNLDRKVRIVMIVNVCRTVDKRDFFHKLKGLRVLLPVEQTLRLDGIETGQKIGGRPSW